MEQNGGLADRHFACEQCCQEVSFTLVARDCDNLLVIELRPRCTSPGAYRCEPPATMTSCLGAQAGRLAKARRTDSQVFLPRVNGVESFRSTEIIA